MSHPQHAPHFIASAAHVVRVTALGRIKHTNRALRHMHMNVFAPGGCKKPNKCMTACRRRLTRRRHAPSIPAYAPIRGLLSVRAMSKAALVAALRRRRSLLLKAYIVHVGCFMSSCAFAATNSVHATVATSLWLMLVTIPPVLFYTALVDRSCRRIDPAAPTVGWLKIVLFTAFLTPIESSLVLPAKNLWVSGRILRSCKSTLTSHSSGRAARAAKS